VGNFTVRLAPLEAAPLAGSTADAADDATQEPSATQSPLNSRRFSKRMFTLYTIPSTTPIVVGPDAVLQPWLYSAGIRRIEGWGLTLARSIRFIGAGCLLGLSCGSNQRINGETIGN
jgi:hypothetical protein